ncbi:MAG: tripartite tricarboxylate transporter permease [Nanoarchaeota archaeon]|nr:tripartite tricarboxylate transporter permease [Nanoarchaeota archaeon]
MLIQIFLFLFLGILVGIFTGLIPGIHVNLIGIILISFISSIFFSINPIYLVVFIISLAITHTFLDFIPSIFLGCPDTDTELSILPGHELLKKGLGYEAIILTAYGSLAAIFMLLIIAYPSILIVPKIYELIKNIVPFLIILISSILILSEKNKKSAFVVFLLSGLLGLSILNLNSESSIFLLPLLTGLFGSSTLILSIKNKAEIPEQKIKNPDTKIYKPLLGALIASPMCSFLPGLGSGQAAVIGNMISKTDQKGFLILLGATNTLVMGFSFISLYVISKTRTGAAVAIKEIANSLSKEVFILILITILISGIISFFLTKFLAKIISQKIRNVNYTKLSIITLLILFSIVFFISGIIGLVILIISTLTGIYCISLNVRRTNMMGCLLIPTIFLYLI